MYCFVSFLFCGVNFSGKKSPLNFIQFCSFPSLILSLSLCYFVHIFSIRYNFEIQIFLAGSDLSCQSTYLALSNKKGTLNDFQLTLIYHFTQKHFLPSNLFTDLSFLHFLINCTDFGFSFVIYSSPFNIGRVFASENVHRIMTT